MADEKVKLFGAWPSPYVYRVIWGLDLKGVKYQYIQEDLGNKSDELLKYNPIHRKVPVLVHNGKPILESLVILEYIDDTWPQNPLLPQDPYQRALARFWIKYIEQKEAVFVPFYLAGGQEREKAAKEVRQVLRTIEDGAFGDDDSIFFGGDEIGMVDLAMGVIAKSLCVIERVVQVKVLDEHEFPRIHRWIDHFRQNSVIKNNLPDFDQMFDYYKIKRQMYISAKKENIA